ncbi:MAG: hypothetical protein ACAI35_07975 [Candidatus Methylacidiphilales bacterium]|nr:hypothetical protein [Candidatus Methylacidiphilales bacterium]
MIELLCVAGILVVAVCQLFLYVCGTKFGTLVLFTLGGMPPMVVVNYLTAVRMLPIGFVRREGEPLPPEIYYWVVTRDKVWASIRILLLAMPLGWAAAFLRPPALPMLYEGLCNWCIALVVVLATARLLALSFLYIIASQTIDRSSPRFIGTLRRWLYQFTSNPDFL